MGLRLHWGFWDSDFPVNVQSHMNPRGTPWGESYARRMSGGTGRWAGGLLIPASA